MPRQTCTPKTRTEERAHYEKRRNLDHRDSRSRIHWRLGALSLQIIFVVGGIAGLHRRGDCRQHTHRLLLHIGNLSAPCRKSQEDRDLPHHGDHKRAARPDGGKHLRCHRQYRELGSCGGGYHTDRALEQERSRCGLRRRLHTVVGALHPSHIPFSCSVSFRVPRNTATHR